MKFLLKYWLTSHFRYKTNELESEKLDNTIKEKRV